MIRSNIMSQSQPTTRFTDGDERASQSAREPLEALKGNLVNYARERPELVALYCFGLVFVLGWKLKPW